MNKTAQRLSELVNLRKQIKGIIESGEYFAAGLKIRLRVGNNEEEVEVDVVEAENMTNILKSILDDIEKSIIYYSSAAKEEIKELNDILNQIRK